MRPWRSAPPEAGSGSTGGSGLGLAIAQPIVKAHYGSLNAQISSAQTSTV
ncbi:hypothetical protein [Scytonema sp. PCC 10023]